MRGKITGPEFAATARILPPEDWPWARKTVKRKYWLARIPFFWSKQNVYLEIEVAVDLAAICALRKLKLACVRNLPHSSFPC